MGPLWQMSVRGDGDIGDIFLIGQEARFLSLRFAMIWRRTVRGPGPPFFLPEAWRLERAGPDVCRSTGTTAPLVRTPKTDVNHLTRAREVWVIGWVTSQREKAAKLEGRYVISRIEQNARLVFRKNLASWTDNQEALWPSCQDAVAGHFRIH